jgi:hypothetical protein
MGTHQDFWQWFSSQANIFFNSIKNADHVEDTFVTPMSEQLDSIREGFYFSAGMYDENTIELVITADCNVKNIVFVEELVAEAPKVEGWNIVALKQPSPAAAYGLTVDGYTFDDDKMFFFSNDHYYYPDEIDITIVHVDLNDENIKRVTLGVNMFLDNYLGELTYVNIIDNLKIMGLKGAPSDLVPITKLIDFLRWRLKEFIEKYDGTWYDNDENHEVFEGELENGMPYVATIDTQLLSWERKASHPWVAIFTINYDGDPEDGMPTDEDMDKLDKIENLLVYILSPKNGHIYVGRETADNVREIFFVCKGFRGVSKIFDKIQTMHSLVYDISYEIYKDKYWQTFERYTE